MNGTVGATLTDAVVRAHGSSQVNAHALKAMPIGPVTAHMSKATTTSPLRHDIVAIVSRGRRTPAWGGSRSHLCTQLSLPIHRAFHL
jgi:hypothetical protein